jgi:hypothetical protein
MTKVAVIDPFNQVYKSHLSNLFEPLKRNDIYYKIFMLGKLKMTKIWESACTIPIDYEEYKLLKPDYKIEEKEFIDSLNFSDYFDKNLYGGDTHNGDHN